MRTTGTGGWGAGDWSVSRMWRGVLRRDIAKVWMDEFDGAFGEGTMFVLTMHPHVSGHRSRIVALELLIAHIESKGPKVWWATHGAAAEYGRKAANLGPPSG